MSPYTLAILTRRQPGLSDEEFFDHYHRTHFASASRLPGLVSYQQARGVHGDQAWTSPESFPDYDALSLYTFESYEAARAAFGSAEGIANDADADKFIEAESVLVFPVMPIQRFDASPQPRPLSDEHS